MKKVGLWTLSVVLGLLAFSGLCALPSSWGMLFFAIPAVLFNPAFRNSQKMRNRQIKRSIIAAATVLPIITTGISIAASPTPPASASTAVTSGAIATSSTVLNPAPTGSKVIPSSTPISSVSVSSQSVVAPTASSGAKLKVHYIDVGQGDSEFIELPNGQCMLIDAGIAEKGPTVVSYIKDLGHNKIDYLIATHPHADHIGGMTDVINTFTIGQMYMPQTSSTNTPTTKTYEGLISAVKSKGIPVHRAKAGVTILMSGNLSTNLIAPCGTNYHDLNQYSAVMMLQYGDNKFLFTGDAGATSESEITTDVKADVLKVGHHGSSTATSQAFLNKVKPKYAIIEVGTGNSYGHPTAQTLSRLQSVGATIYRTDKDGTIIFTSDSHTITIDKKASTTKEQAPPTTGKVTTGSVAAAVGGSITSKAPSTGNDNTIVYITDTGKKYHTAGCRTLKKSKHAITLKEAKARGYTPCGICHPPE